MTTLPQQDTIKQYIGDGIADDFVIPFYTPVSDLTGAPALDIYITPPGQEADPAIDIKVWSVDYTYAPNLDPISGGTLHFLPGKIPELGALVTASRNVPAELEVDFADARNFSGETLDNVLSQLLLIEQQNKTYALQRNLSYRVNSFLPDDFVLANTQIPLLGDGQIWYGSGTGVIAVTLEQNPDVSTLRSELANDMPGTDGARLIGYYDGATTTPTTVDTFLNRFAVNTSGNDGARMVGYYDAQTATATTVQAFLAALVAGGQLVPTGMIVDFGMTSVPTGYLACNGAAVSRTTYAALFLAIGTTWGVGDGSTTFNVPNLARRTKVGSGGSGSGILANTTGSTGGAETYTLTTADVPNLNVSVSRNVRQGSSTAPGDPVCATGTVLGTLTMTGTTTNGGGGAHTIMQPSAVVTMAIKT